MPGFAEDATPAVIAELVRGPAVATSEVAPALDSTDINNRDIRQRGILPAEKLNNFEVTVVGVGAIGSEISKLLASMGVGKVTIWDHDTVGTENLAPQRFKEAQVGVKKVVAVAEEMKALNSSLVIDSFPSRLRSSWIDSLPNAKEDDMVKRVLFVAVDTMDARRNFYDTARLKFHFVIDTRMNAEVLRILAFNTLKPEFDYSKTLFTEAEAVQGTCTSRSLNYTSAIAAGLAMHRFTQAVREHPIQCDFLLDLNAALYKNMLEPTGFAED